MTLADHLSEEDLLLLTEPEPGPQKSRREPPPGAETMARPWRLAIVGIGVTIGLIARLLAANGYFSVNSHTMVYAAALTSILAGVGLVALAAERDRFDRWMVLLAAGTGLSLGALQWASPHFSSGTLEWSNAGQIALALLGIANGVLLAGILTLAFVRRWPTMSVVGVLSAGVLTLAADSVLLRNEWPAIGALALAFGGVLLAWDQAPRHEPTYAAPTESPRISRAALSLATVVLGGWVLQLWLSRGESVRRIPAAGVVSAILIALAFLAMVRIRREIQRRDTTINEWTSWMREIRTGDLRSDFETLSTSADGRTIGDVTGEAPRPLSFPDLRAAAAEREDAPAEADDTATDVDLTSRELPVIDAPPAPAPEMADVDVNDDLDAAAIDLPDADAPRRDAPAIPLPDAATTPMQPRLFGDEPPAAAGVVWADDEATLDDTERASSVPVVGADQPALFDYQHVLTPPSAPDTTPDPEPAPAPALTPAPEPASASAIAPAIPLPTSAADDTSQIAPGSAFSELLGESDTPAPAPAPPEAEGDPLAPSGAFSSWLEDGEATGSAAPSDTSTTSTALAGTLDDLALWLADPGVGDARRLVAAVETMSLADFDELPPEVSAAATIAMVERLQTLTPTADLVTRVDGPYLMVAWPSIDGRQLGDVNRGLLEAMATPVDTEHGAVGLTGTLALLRPVDGTTIDGIIEQAIQGLVQARQLEAIAAEAR